MGFYGNYYKINAGEGLIVKEKGQSIDIELEPYIINAISEKSLFVSISNIGEFNMLVTQGLTRNDAPGSIAVGQSVLVLDDIDLTTASNKGYYLDHDELEDNILKENTILVCVYINESTLDQYLFKNAKNLKASGQIQELFWNKDENKPFYFYDDDCKDSEFIENNSIIVDSQKQTIAIQKDGEEVVLGKNLPLEKTSGENSVQSSDSDNEILADSSFGFGKGLKNTEQNRNQFIRGTYNEIDEEGKYIDIVGNGLDNEHRSNAYELDKEGNAYFAGDVYIKNKEGQEPIKLQNFELEPQQNFVTVSNNGQDGVEITDIGDYYVSILTQFPDQVFCNDGISNNKIGWPYLETISVVSGGVEVINNQDGSLTINGTTNQNIEIIFQADQSLLSTKSHRLQVFTSNCPEGIIAFNFKEEAKDEANCRLYHRTDGQYAILIDINILEKPVTFNNAILYPYISEAEKKDVGEVEDALHIQDWQTPIGTQYNVPGQIKIKPTKQDKLLFRTFNKTNILTISYYKNINLILNISNNAFNQDCQIALKRDCEKVYGYEVEVNGDVETITNKRLYMQPYFRLTNSGSVADNYKPAENLNEQARNWTINNLYTKFMTNSDLFYNERNGYHVCDKDGDNFTYTFDKTHVYKLDHQKKIAKLVCDVTDQVFGEYGKIKSKINYSVSVGGGKTYSDFDVDGIFAVDDTWMYIIIHNIDTENTTSESHQEIKDGVIIVKQIAGNNIRYLPIEKAYLLGDYNYEYVFDRRNNTNTRVYQNKDFIVFYNLALTSRALIFTKYNNSIINNTVIWSNISSISSECFDDQFILLNHKNQIITFEYYRGYKEAGLNWYKISCVKDENNKDKIQLSYLINGAFNLSFKSIVTSGHFYRSKIFVYGNHKDEYHTKVVIPRQVMLKIEDNSNTCISVIQETDFVLDQKIQSSQWNGKTFYLDPYIPIKHYTKDTNIISIAGNKAYFSITENKFFYDGELLDFTKGEYIALNKQEILSDYTLIPYSYMSKDLIYVVKIRGNNINKLHVVDFVKKIYEISSWRGEELWP